MVAKTMVLIEPQNELLSLSGLVLQCDTTEIKHTDRYHISRGITESDYCITDFNFFFFLLSL